MPSETTPLLHPRGKYVKGGPNDKRSPCPLVNSLANHGYIARDGQNIPAGELNAALGEVGLSSLLSAFFAKPIYNLRQDAKILSMQKRMGFMQRAWNFVRNPWSLLSVFGLRRVDQKDKHGKPVINLDQLALPGVIEHDISMTRRDHVQLQGNSERQMDLIEDLIKRSRDGDILTMENFADHRKHRIQQQLYDNPALHYGSEQHKVACTEIALVLAVFGNGESVPCEFARAFFMEERLPVNEGWKKRWWWTVGLMELKKSAKKVKELVGLNI